MLRLRWRLSTKRPSGSRRLNPWQALRDIEKLRHQALPGAGLDPHVVLLRDWQSRRLARTYADLLEHPRYRPACRFFLEDLYGPKDFSQRDHDLTQMHAFLQSFVPEALIHPLNVTVELHALTQALDARLLDVLVQRLGVTDTLTAALYAEAYRLCENYPERVRQIELIVEIGELLEGIVRLPLIDAALAVARGPAKRAGWVELTDFLERGYAAFKHMRGATFFLATFRRRERSSPDKIYAREPDPFGFQLP